MPEWEPYGAIALWGPFGMCVCCMEAMYTGLEPYGSQIAPLIWESIWELLVPYGSCVFVIWELCVCHMGVVCTI
jgi:hypothetical protein